MLKTSLCDAVEARRKARLLVGPSKALGQHFTPWPTATLIASMVNDPGRPNVRVLDPGAGLGSLTAAALERLLECRQLKHVEVIAFETDPTIHRDLKATLDDCVAVGARRGTTVEYSIYDRDFLAPPTLEQQGDSLGQFDVIVMNPPYYKISRSEANDHSTRLGLPVCPNAYATFTARALQLLRDEGQLVAITPRSFANGPYYSDFRRYLLKHSSLNKLHIFESRSSIFADSGVLQENIIFGVGKTEQRKQLDFSSSVSDNTNVDATIVEYERVVQPKDPAKFIRIVSTESELELAQMMEALPCKLSDLGLRVATGKVVDFRCKELHRAEKTSDSVPLIYPGNLQSGMILWPKQMKKPQALLDDHSKRARALISPQNRYLLAKRFSSKEERRRIVAALWDPSDQPGEVAFENHLNVIQVAEPSGELSRDLAVGLLYWLNSSVLDSYFRTFSGHTQVNATDLRSLRWPSLSKLSALGDGRDARLPDQQIIDDLVSSFIVPSEVSDEN